MAPIQKINISEFHKAQQLQMHGKSAGDQQTLTAEPVNCVSQSDSTDAGSVSADSISEGLTPRSHSQGQGLALTFSDGQRMDIKVKNTFLNFVLNDTVALRRSASAPALLVEAEAQKSSCDEKAEAVVKYGAEMQLAHDEGRCRPCLFFAFKNDTCRIGDDCPFCHLCTRSEILAKRKENKIAARKAMRQENEELWLARRTRLGRPDRRAARKQAGAEKADAAEEAVGATPTRTVGPAV